MPGRRMLDGALMANANVRTVTGILSFTTSPSTCTTSSTAAAAQQISLLAVRRWYLPGQRWPKHCAAPLIVPFVFKGT
jgi:hypothetical protein